MKIENIESTHLVKSRSKVCQAESARIARFLRSEQHILGFDAPATAICCVKIPIRRSNIVASSEAEGTSNAVNSGRRALNLKEYSGGCFIEVQMNPAKSEAGPVFS